MQFLGFVFPLEKQNIENLWFSGFGIENSKTFKYNLFLTLSG
jgi:hypothetical protein